MNISIVSSNHYMSGTYINFLDLHHHLICEGKHSTTFYYTQLDKNGYWLPHMIEKSGRNYIMGNHMKLYGVVWVKDDVIITDFRGLVFCHRWNIPLMCSKLIIMDSVELSYHLNDTKNAPHWFDWEFSYKIPMYNYLDIHTYDEILFVMPDVNKKIFDVKYNDLKSQVFYKKINWDALRTVKVEDNGKYCYRADEPNLKYYMLERIKQYDNLDLQAHGSIFKYGGFIFHKRKRLCYWEQFGRIIFEYVMLGKKVRFVSNPLETKDGLFDYINHYNIEIDDGECVTSKEELIEKMASDYEVKPWE